MLEHQRHAREIEEEKRRQKAARAKDIYDNLKVKVQAIREKNLPPEQWTVAQLNTMIQWHKRPEDAAMPSKKGETLAGYHEIKERGDPQEPQLLEQQIPPLPPLPGSELDPNMMEANGDATDSNDENDAGAALLVLFASEV